jgi:fucose permease
MNKSLHKLLPVLFGFFVMGFCDVVGISTSYVQQDFGLSETLAGFIPSMVFIWFLLLSIPAALAMNRLGRKNMVQISNGITAVGMLIPFVHYNLATCMTAFVLLGIGNTILQVSLNPLLTNVVKGDALTSSLTAGQVVKAVSSFCGPFIAAFAAGTLGNWQYLFPIFALITLLSAAWLMCTPIREEAEAPQASPVGATFALLKDRTVLLLFLGIVFVVGVGLELVFGSIGFAGEERGNVLLELVGVVIGVGLELVIFQLSNGGFHIRIQDCCVISCSDNVINDFVR